MLSLQREQLRGRWVKVFVYSSRKCRQQVNELLSSTNLCLWASASKNSQMKTKVIGTPVIRRNLQIATTYLYRKHSTIAPPWEIKAIFAALGNKLIRGSWLYVTDEMSLKNKRTIFDGTMASTSKTKRGPHYNTNWVALAIPLVYVRFCPAIPEYDGRMLCLRPSSEEGGYEETFEQSTTI